MKTLVTRSQAITNLKKHLGHELSIEAKKLGITMYLKGKQNKGWKGVVLERIAGLNNSNAKAPNGEYWELKSVSFTLQGNKLVPKETMAITMINPQELEKYNFFESHCWHKLKSLVFCAVQWNGLNSKEAKLLDVASFDFFKSDKLLLEIKADYDFIRNKLIKEGFSSLTGKDGKWIQARTKGTGGINPNTGKRRPITRAFYARRILIEEIFKLKNQNNT